MLIMDMTNSELAAEINKLTRKPMSSSQMFRYRSLSTELTRRHEAARAESERQYLKAYGTQAV